jgi:hypothetical protein
VMAAVPTDQVRNGCKAVVVVYIRHIGGGDNRAVATPEELEIVGSSCDSPVLRLRRADLKA